MHSSWQKSINSYSMADAMSVAEPTAVPSSITLHSLSVMITKLKGTTPKTIPGKGEVIELFVKTTSSDGTARTTTSYYTDIGNPEGPTWDNSFDFPTPPNSTLQLALMAGTNFGDFPVARATVEPHKLGLSEGQTLEAWIPLQLLAEQQKKIVDSPDFTIVTTPVSADGLAPQLKLSLTGFFTRSDRGNTRQLARDKSRSMSLVHPPPSPPDTAASRTESSRLASRSRSSSPPPPAAQRRSPKRARNHNGPSFNSSIGSTTSKRSTTSSHPTSKRFASHTPLALPAITPAAAMAMGSRPMSQRDLEPTSLPFITTSPTNSPSKRNSQHGLPQVGSGHHSAGSPADSQIMDLEATYARTKPPSSKQKRRNKKQPNGKARYPHAAIAPVAADTSPYEQRVQRRLHRNSLSQQAPQYKYKYHDDSRTTDDEASSHPSMLQADMIHNIQHQAQKLIEEALKLQRKAGPPGFMMPASRQPQPRQRVFGNKPRPGGGVRALLAATSSSRKRADQQAEDKMKKEKPKRPAWNSSVVDLQTWESDEYTSPKSGNSSPTNRASKGQSPKDLAALHKAPTRNKEGFRAFELGNASTSMKNSLRMKPVANTAYSSSDEEDSPITSVNMDKLSSLQDHSMPHQSADIVSAIFSERPSASTGGNQDSKNESEKLRRQREADAKRRRMQKNAQGNSVNNNDDIPIHLRMLGRRVSSGLGGLIIDPAEYPQIQLVDDSGFHMDSESGTPGTTDGVGESIGRVQQEDQLQQSDKADGGPQNEEEHGNLVETGNEEEANLADNENAEHADEVEHDQQNASNEAIQEESSNTAEKLADDARAGSAESQQPRSEKTALEIKSSNQPKRNLSLDDDFPDPTPLVHTPTENDQEDMPPSKSARGRSGSRDFSEVRFGTPNSRRSPSREQRANGFQESTQSRRSTLKSGGTDVSSVLTPSTTHDSVHNETNAIVEDLEEGTQQSQSGRRSTRTPDVSGEGRVDEGEDQDMDHSDKPNEHRFSVACETASDSSSVLTVHEEEEDITSVGVGEQVSPPETEDEELQTDDARGDEEVEEHNTEQQEQEEREEGEEQLVEHEEEEDDLQEQAEQQTEDSSKEERPFSTAALDEYLADVPQPVVVFPQDEEWKNKDDSNAAEAHDGTKKKKKTKSPHKKRKTKASQNTTSHKSKPKQATDSRTTTPTAKIQHAKRHKRGKGNDSDHVVVDGETAEFTDNFAELDRYTLDNKRIEQAGKSKRKKKKGSSSKKSKKNKEGEASDTSEPSEHSGKKGKSKSKKSKKSKSKENTQSTEPHTTTPKVGDEEMAVAVAEGATDIDVESDGTIEGDEEATTFLAAQLEAQRKRNRREARQRAREERAKRLADQDRIHQPVQHSLLEASMVVDAETRQKQRQEVLIKRLQWRMAMEKMEKAKMWDEESYLRTLIEKEYSKKLQQNFDTMNSLTNKQENEDNMKDLQDYRIQLSRKQFRENVMTLSEIKERKLMEKSEQASKVREREEHLEQQRQINIARKRALTAQDKYDPTYIFDMEYEGRETLDMMQRKEWKALLNAFRIGSDEVTLIVKTRQEAVEHSRRDAEIEAKVQAELDSYTQANLAKFIKKEASQTIWAEQENLHYWSKEVDGDEGVGNGALDMTVLKQRYDTNHRKHEVLLLRRKMSAESRQVFLPHAYYRLYIQNEYGVHQAYKIRYDTLLFKVLDHFVKYTDDQHTNHEFIATANGDQFRLDPSKSGIHYLLPDETHIQAYAMKDPVFYGSEEE